MFKKYFMLFALMLVLLGIGIMVYTGEGHIAPYFGYLVAYYNREETPFEVVFPQMSIEMS